MAEVNTNGGYKSGVVQTGEALDALLGKIKDATAATEDAAGTGGMIPAPPAGSQDGSKVLKSNLTWGDQEGGVEPLDLGMFGSNTGTLTQAQYDSIQNAFDKNVNIGKMSGVALIPIMIMSSGGTYNIYYSYASWSGDFDANFAISTISVKSDKTYDSISYSAGLPQATYEYIGFITHEPVVVTTLANLPHDSHNIIANVSAATNLSVSSLTEGRDLQIRVNNTTSSVITQTIPTTGNYDCLDGTSVEIPANGFIELNIWKINSKYVIRIGQKQ